MERSTAIALVLAPIIGPMLWWLYTRPGKLGLWLAKKLPEGRLKRLLLADTKIEEPTIKL